MKHASPVGSTRQSQKTSEHRFRHRAQVRHSARDSDTPRAIQTPQTPRAIASSELSSASPCPFFRISVSCRSRMVGDATDPLPNCQAMRQSLNIESCSAIRKHICISVLHLSFLSLRLLTMNSFLRAVLAIPWLRIIQKVVHHKPVPNTCTRTPSVAQTITTTSFARKTTMCLEVPCHAVLAPGSASTSTCRLLLVFKEVGCMS